MPCAQGTAGLGENLYQVSGPAGSLPPVNQVIAQAVSYWYAEIQYYNYANPGARPALPCGPTTCTTGLAWSNCAECAGQSAPAGRNERPPPVPVFPLSTCIRPAADCNRRLISVTTSDLRSGSL